MNGTLFEKPVAILVGLGFPRKIGSANEAYQLLSDMRLTASHGAHRMAMQVCKAAIEGKVDPQIARSAFVAFARRTAMLLSNDHSEPNSDTTSRRVRWSERSTFRD